jgi:undecaprenyl-phosphate 4-deoxy-4-formamido-L-arabinose transferase
VSFQRITKGVSVVIPAYRSSSSIGLLVERICTVFQERDFEVVIVVDGSPDDTWKEVVNIATRNSRVTGIRLGRNAGQHGALLAGLRFAQFDTTVTLDDDLQHPPEEIPKLMAALNDDIDIVYGVPEQVAQTLVRRFGSWLTRGVLKGVLGAPNATDFSSFRAFRTSLRDGFSDELGPGVSLDALLAWSTDRFDSRIVRHDPRWKGRSNFTLRKLVNFALDMATGYSTRPLRFALRLGILTGLLGFVLMSFVVCRALFLGVAVPGFPFLASTIALFAGVQLITLGVIGEYLARMHFRVMSKPTYVVAEVHRGKQ